LSISFTSASIKLPVGPAAAAMVYYFTSNVVEPSGFIYVGKDKFESK